MEVIKVIKRRTEISVDVVPVIRIQTVVGRGTEEDPITTQYEYWNMDGKLLFILGVKGNSHDQREVRELFGGV